MPPPALPPGCSGAPTAATGRYRHRYGLGCCPTPHKGPHKDGYRQRQSQCLLQQRLHCRRARCIRRQDTDGSSTVGCNLHTHNDRSVGLLDGAWARNGEGQLGRSPGRHFHQYRVHTGCGRVSVQGCVRAAKARRVQLVEDELLTKQAQQWAQVSSVRKGHARYQAPGGRMRRERRRMDHQWQGHGIAMCTKHGYAGVSKVRAHNEGMPGRCGGPVADATAG
jgi:hypothetical protein